MTTTYDPNLRIALQGDNDNPNTWGQILNGESLTLLTTAIAGVITIDMSGPAETPGTVDIDMSTGANVGQFTGLPGVATGATDVARNAVLELTGVLGANINLIVPAVKKVYLVRTNFSGAYTVAIKPVGGVATAGFPTGESFFVYTNGTNIYSIGAGALLAANNLSDLANAATARTNLGLGTAAVLNAGTAASNLVQLDGSAKLPAVDGSQLLNVSAAPLGLGTAAYLNVGTTAGSVVQLNGSGQLPAINGSLLAGVIASNGATVTNSSSGKIVLGAVTIQWGNVTATVPGTLGNYPGNAVTFGTAFSGTAYHVSASTVLTSSPSNFTTGQDGVPSVNAITASGFNYQLPTNTPFPAFINWMAIGPT